MRNDCFVVQTVLSDGSLVFDVRVESTRDDGCGDSVDISCTDEKMAERIRDAILDPATGFTDPMDGDYQIEHH